MESRYPMASAINPLNDPSTQPTLVYDGSCGFCSRSVRFILRHERRHDLLFVTRDSEMGKQLRRTHGIESIESMLWIEDGRAFAESNAVMKAAGYVGGWWLQLAALASLFPPNILNRLYKIIARHRRRLSTNVAVCQLPSPEQRRRFLA
jgi:predicted DCC family thiol-disulfide oxidoreductase YuxK